METVQLLLKGNLAPLATLLPPIHYADAKEESQAQGQ